jgi:peptidoglycan-N-acetylmuramic acid deacetylase PdaC-like protein
MKRIAVKIIISVLAFASGLLVASIWNTDNSVETEPCKVIELPKAATPAATVVPEPTPNHEVVFGRDRLRIVPEQVQLRSKRLRYEIDVTYPRIVGGKDRHIRRLNQRIKRLTTEQYAWALNVTTKELEPLNKYFADVFNSIDLDYDVLLATDSVLSIFFNGYSYGIGAAHGSQFSFVINYDLASGKELKLARLFKPGSKYLEFISHYCIDALPLDHAGRLEFTKDPESWNITSDGLRFHFDHCKFFACSEGYKKVDIPFAAMNEILNPTSAGSVP